MSLIGILLNQSRAFMMPASCVPPSSKNWLFVLTQQPRQLSGCQQRRDYLDTYTSGCLDCHGATRS
jgi:hypothetical protein